MIKDHPLIQKLLTLHLPEQDFAVMGGGCLFAAGLKDLNHDIDLIAIDSAWDKAATLGQITPTKSNLGKVITFFDGEVEVFNQWFPGEWNLRQLIDEADIKEGIRFVKLKEVLKWKRLFNRPKDQEHIQLIEEYLKTHV